MSGFAKGIIGMIGLALSAVVVMTLVPTGPRAVSEAVKSVEGVVTELATPCCGDVVLHLRGDGRSYYLQGALGDGRSFSEWGDRLMNETVTLDVAPFAWSEDRPQQQMVPVTRIAVGGEDFYTTRR